MLTLYKSLVRPILEYFSPVWSPFLRKDIDKLERVQRRVTKMMASVRHLPYNQRLKALNIPSLEHRRLRFDVIALYKIIHKYDNLDHKNYMEFANSITRGNNFKLKKFGMNNNIEKHWFFNRVVNTWNSLPNDIAGETSLAKFKSKIHLHLPEYWE